MPSCNYEPRLNGIMYMLHESTYPKQQMVRQNYLHVSERGACNIMGTQTSHSVSNLTFVVNQTKKEKGGLSEWSWFGWYQGLNLIITAKAQISVCYNSWDCKIVHSTLDMRGTLI
mmetsp:Transcript_6532/g.11732  ORF Transcript_6532/g.11732 Transcript_6532/m.11732 type:complete len:115 (-) Transcript_6532:3003-3347(-)